MEIALVLEANEFDDPNFTVEFRELTRGGYSVWVSDPDTGRMRKRLQSADCLCWQNVARQIAASDLDLQIGSDYPDSQLLAFGVDELEGMVLLRCWTSRMPRPTLSLLTRLSKDELNMFWRAAEHGLSEEPEPFDRENRFWELLDSVAQLAAQSQFTEPSPTRIADQLGLVLKGPSDLVQLERSLRAFVADQGIVRRIEQEGQGYALAANVLEELQEYPSPSSPETVARLLYSWVVCEQRPRSGRVSGIGVSGMEFPYLSWLLAAGIEVPLSLLAKAHPTEAKTFVGWALYHRKNSGERLENPGHLGGGLAAQMGAIIHRTQAYFCMDILRAAKAAGLYDGDPDHVDYYVHSRNNSWESPPDWKRFGPFPVAEQAEEAARQVIDESLRKLWNHTMSATDLIDAQSEMGRSATIYGIAKTSFNQYKYIKDRANQIAKSATSPRQ